MTYQNEIKLLRNQVEHVVTKISKIIDNVTQKEFEKRGITNDFIKNNHERFNVVVYQEADSTERSYYLDGKHLFDITSVVFYEEESITLKIFVKEGDKT